MKDGQLGAPKKRFSLAALAAGSEAARERSLVVAEV
jgi:hypothetical protein